MYTRRTCAIVFAWGGKKYGGQVNKIRKYFVTLHAKRAMTGGASAIQTSLMAFGLHRHCLKE
jgi:hypothetical protein